MTRKLKRTPHFDLTLNIHDENFIRPPRDAQRNSILNRAMREFSDDLNALDKTARGFVHGADNQPSFSDLSQADLGDQEIMEDWQIPIMKAMASSVASGRGDVLEVGFGRGISASLIQDQGVKSHTIIECNNYVVRRFQGWREAYPNRDIRLMHAKWQDTLDDLDQYDGILFHTYPLDVSEYQEYVATSVTFAAHFFPVAANLLRPGGVFTYFSNEIDSLSRSHQRALFDHFRSIGLKVLSGLDIPPTVGDTWWSDSMVIVKAIK